VNPTSIVEETQQPAPEGTSRDIPAEVQEQPNQDTETLKEVQLENTEAAPKFNGTVSNLEAPIKLDESKTTISDHPPEGIVEYVMVWSEWYTEEQLAAVGTSS
jgi:hypothetical protein